jgi:hypothetical protein
LRAPTFNTGAPFGAALCVINAEGPKVDGRARQQCPISSGRLA